MDHPVLSTAERCVRGFQYRAAPLRNGLYIHKKRLPNETPNLYTNEHLPKFCTMLSDTRAVGIRPFRYPSTYLIIFLAPRTRRPCDHQLGPGSYDQLFPSGSGANI